MHTQTPSRTGSLLPTVVRLAVAAVGLAMACASFAQDYPNKPIRVIVPYAPGGLPDAVIRRIAPRMEKELGQSLVIDNKPGANGVVSASALLAAPADGYTVIFSDAAFISITPLAMKNPPYNPARDFVPVTLAATAPNFLALHPSVPAKNLNEFIAYVQKNPGKVTCGSSGVGTLHHLSLEAMKHSLNLDVTHIPFRGSGQSVPAMVGGQTQCTLAALPSLVGHAAVGKANIIAIAGNRTSPLLPEAEAMFAGRQGGHDFSFLLGIVARQGTPAAVVNRLTAAVKVAVEDAENVASLRKMGVEPAGLPSAGYASALSADAEQLARVAKLANLQAE
ncbi:tripartite tricarboxylate transporter substrate binding protein [Hydrogenophaga sp.]|uniref:Bug family tripartite tricarboxylate transporter substrate binding protein n=1 Tax=Hydrogenophaga sp. TaxID=1904254 RepID=UPI00271A76EB|nr:tripartite tricarboxylate transporter substrate binding protein [Hydrogenophaga sp.]MDO9434397.1 tripartite tricarboxylate transporter substrate binding protein [Hydrogenophaga sp.]